MDWIDRRLAVGESTGMWVEMGAEVFCAVGVVRLSGPMAPHVLAAGSGWRAAVSGWVGVEAMEAARLRVAAIPLEAMAVAVEPRPRFAGSVRAWVAAIASVTG
jgi:hypothetical protein